MNASRPWLPTIIIVTLIAVLLCGCITIEKTANYDFSYKERLKTAIEEILRESEKSELQLFTGQRDKIDQEEFTFVRRHFSKANEIVLQHATEERQAIPFVVFNEYLEKRKALFDYTLKLESKLSILEADIAYAVTFPSGRIVLSEPLARALYADNDEYNSVLLGILIHELVHVRDGHAIEQWATADGRNEWVSSKILGAMANASVLIPFLSLKYDLDYGVAFKSSKQLPELSEYAADLATALLLAQHGFSRDDYIAFLTKINAISRSSKAAAKEPFSWLQGRTACLKVLTATHFEEGVPKIVIGSKEDGDRVVWTLDVDIAYKKLTELDSPRALRQRYYFGTSQQPSDAGLRRLALGDVQNTFFVACAIHNVFSDIKPVNGVLTTPGFDLSMFLLHCLRTPDMIRKEVGP
jgi:hypothetical protein